MKTRCARPGEDLEGYAGAGLYDSITMDTTELRKVDYAADRSAPQAQHSYFRVEQRLPCNPPLL